MQTLTRPKTPLPAFRPPRSRRRKRFSPFMLIGVAVTLLIVIGAGIYTFIQSNTGTHAADANPDCTLIVPSNPLSAQGLATPFQLTATNPNNGPCKESNAAQSAFVQGAIFDPATAQISLYDPLVIDRGTQPAVKPTPVKIPPQATVALWFGFNGNNLTLRGRNGALQQGRCVNGLPGSIFGQFSYCNAPAFFAAANQAIAAGRLVPPPLGTGKDGLACPTVRDFGIVDQDQSDNVTTEYLITANGATAQLNAANTAQLQNAQAQANGSDNRLEAVAVDGALGCNAWKAPNLADNGNMEPSLPLNELQAAASQARPIALVPPNDPMVLVGNNMSTRKMNLYRAGVNQPPAAATAAAAAQYCQNLVNVGPKRIFADRQFTQGAASPDPATGNNLFTFLAARFNASLQNLNCQQQSPIQVQTDGNGVAISATMGKGNANSAAVSCSVDGKAVQGCAGTAQVNGQPATFAFNAQNNQITVTSSQGANAAAGTQQNAGAQQPANNAAAAGTQQNAAPNCRVDGKAVQGCAGTAQVNGQPATFAFNAQNNQITVTSSQGANAGGQQNNGGAATPAPAAGGTPGRQQNNGGATPIPAPNGGRQQNNSGVTPTPAPPGQPNNGGAPSSGSAAPGSTSATQPQANTGTQQTGTTAFTNPPRQQTVPGSIQQQQTTAAGNQQPVANAAVSPSTQNVSLEVVQLVAGIYLPD